MTHSPDLTRNGDLYRTGSQRGFHPGFGLCLSSSSAFFKLNLDPKASTADLELNVSGLALNAYEIPDLGSAWTLDTMCIHNPYITHYSSFHFLFQYLISI